MRHHSRPRHVVSLVAVAALSVAGCSSMNGAAPSTAPIAPQDVGDGPGGLSCASEIQWAEMPEDLRSKKLTRYTQLVMDGQVVMRYAIGPSVTDAQVQRMLRLTRFYLSDVPGSTFGADKSAVREAMAKNFATMVSPDGAHEEGASDGLPQGQELYAAEISPEGSSWYVENNFDHRDASMEEIFHQVHDQGIGTAEKRALPQYQEKLLARATATKGTVWGLNSDDWLKELEAEGSLAQEYIVAVIDSWYGQWGPWQGKDGMWDTYVAKNRSDVESEDAAGAQLLHDFLPDVLEYEAYVDPEFSGTFLFTFDEATPYTHKSQYLRGARLTGSNDSGLTGNALDNTLRGNAGDNALDGGDGHDVALYCQPQSKYTVATANGITTVTGPDGTDTLTNIERIAFSDATVDVAASPSDDSSGG